MSTPRSHLGFGFVLALAACDPGWGARNPATATKDVDATCIEAGLRAWGPEVKPVPSTDGARVDFLVKSPATNPYAIHVEWDKRTPTQITLEVHSLGSSADPKTIDGYRSVRDEAVARIGAACSATITLGPETCQRCK